MGSTGTVLRELRGAQKTAKGVSLYSRYVNRPAGRVLAAAAHRARMTPNQVTLVSAAFTFASITAIALAGPTWALGVLVWAGLVVGFAFDSADGQLARLTGRGGPDGEWLDHVVDCAKMVLVHTAVLISLYRADAYRIGEQRGETWLLLPLGFLFVAVLTFCAGLLREQLGRAAQRADAPAAPAGPVSRVRAVALLPADYGVFCLVFLLLGEPAAFLAGYAALAVVHALFLVAFLAKWFRELRALRAG
ncbi:CDP-alcohol phosphatidyltransferase family protein [Streptomyces sp. NBC_01218]|uniref:CDP-alcohol phosphatidyltransferase family protein n=1 Tax=unclassified Streptomyces TaxID=2593676 RepID=UPI002E166B74|nr:CDP-alcohol phosphatidyltransferase family protein [Streptomyces sp. NBC_01218]